MATKRVALSVTQHFPEPKVSTPTKTSVINPGGASWLTLIFHTRIANRDTILSNYPSRLHQRREQPTETSHR